MAAVAPVPAASAPTMKNDVVAIKESASADTSKDIDIKPATTSLLPPAVWAPYTYPLHFGADYKRPHLNLTATGNCPPHDHCYGFKFIRDPWIGGLKYTLWCWHTYRPTPVSLPIEHSDVFKFWDFPYTTVILNGNPIRVKFEDSLSSGVESLSLASGSGGFSQGGFANTGFQTSNTQPAPALDSAKTDKEFYVIAYVNKPFDIDFSGEAGPDESIFIVFDKTTFTLEGAGTRHKEVFWNFVPNRLSNSTITVYKATQLFVLAYRYHVTVVGIEPALTTSILPPNIWFPDFTTLLDQALVIVGRKYGDAKLLRAQAGYFGIPAGVPYPWDLNHITALFETAQGQVSIVSASPGIWDPPTKNKSLIIGLTAIDIGAIKVDLYNPHGVYSVLRARHIKFSGFLSAVLFNPMLEMPEPGPRYDVYLRGEEGDAFHQEVLADHDLPQAEANATANGTANGMSMPPPLPPVGVAA